jgi:hypothetical protein
MFLSSTVSVVELIVVVVPFIVKSPESVRLVPEIAPVNVAPDSAATFSAKATVPVASGRVIVLSAVESATVKTVSNSLFVAPSYVIKCASGSYIP